MKYLSLFLLAILYSNFLAAQSDIDTKISEIRQHFQWINSQSDFDVVESSNEDHSDQTFDHGTQIKGFFKKNELYKVINWVGLSTGPIITEYYLWEDELIFVYRVGKRYGQVKDKDGIFLEFDYSKMEVVFEKRIYFSDNQEIKRLEEGEFLSFGKSDENFSNDIKRFRQILKK